MQSVGGSDLATLIIVDEGPGLSVLHSTAAERGAELMSEQF